MTDWIFAASGIKTFLAANLLTPNFLAFPYIINYIRYWNPVEFYYEPYFFVISSLCLTIQFKINLVIALSIAIDRFQVCSLNFL